MSVKSVHNKPFFAHVIFQETKLSDIDSIYVYRAQTTCQAQFKAKLQAFSTLLLQTHKAQ